MATFPDEEPGQPRIRPEFAPERPHFTILDHIEARRRVGRNWVAQCPSLPPRGVTGAKIIWPSRWRSRGSTCAGLAAQRNRSGRRSGRRFRL